MKLRPHHLLCTQSFVGKGYSDAFVAHMTQLTNYLKNHLDASIQLVFSADDLCTACPNLQADGLCQENKKITTMDHKVVRYFMLEEADYHYATLVSQIRSQLTEQILADICSSCEWYSVAPCKSLLFATQPPTKDEQNSVFIR